jgi:nitroreductase
MNQPVQEFIRQRHSCRSYLEKPIEETHRQTLSNFLNTLQIGPLNTHARFTLAAATQDDRRSLKGLGTYGFIKNPAGFIIGAVEQGRWNLEDYGYLLEYAILAATDMGLGTCWLGGSFTKSTFAKKICLSNSEKIPAVAAAGYKAKNGVREIIRYQINAHRRLPMDQLFFSESFNSPINFSSTTPYANVLEMVRLAPSASNKQPWRIIQIGNAWHFFLQRTKGYGKGTLIFNILRLADLQRVDMGIAMCHFELTAVSLGLHGRWRSEVPSITIPQGMEYIISWIQE